MSASESQKKASKKYINEKLDEIKVRVPKGEKDIIKAHAESQDESVSAFVYRAVKETMKRDLRKKKK